jgi:hypothetical protein
MNRFRERLNRADARINRAFAEAVPAELRIGNVRRAVTVIFESPDTPVSVPGGGEIQDHSPAFSAMTAEIIGLAKNDGVVINGVNYRVTHVGTDEEGRTRVTLGYGEPGKPQPEIKNWS